MTSPAVVRSALIPSLLLCAGCSSPPASPTPPPKPEIFEGTLRPSSPSFSVTVGPAPAGRWRADLAHANVQMIDKSVSLTVRDASGAVVARGKPVTPNFQTAEWEGGPGATYRIDIVLGDPSGLVLGQIFTLQVTPPQA